jgi:hypothetical protein
MKVSVTYEGNTVLTVQPPIGSVSTLKNMDTVTITESAKANEFSAKESVVASVWNHKDYTGVSIEGGNWVQGTSPMTVTVDLL